MRRFASRLTIVTLLLLAATGMVAQAGSVPHVHAVSHAGVYNEEHDLTLLAGLASSLLLAAEAPVLTFHDVSALVPQHAPEHVAVLAALSGDSRAPPVR